jgi:chromosome segregation ATPase
MPFRSESQRRYLFSKRPDIAKKWTNKYGSTIVSEHLRNGKKVRTHKRMILRNNYEPIEYNKYDYSPESNNLTTVHKESFPYLTNIDFTESERPHSSFSIGSLDRPLSKLKPIDWDSKEEERKRMYEEKRLSLQETKEYEREQEREATEQAKRIRQFTRMAEDIERKTKQDLEKQQAALKRIEDNQERYISKFTKDPINDDEYALKIAGFTKEKRTVMDKYDEIKEKTKKEQEKLEEIKDTYAKLKNPLRQLKTGFKYQQFPNNPKWKSNEKYQTAVNRVWRLI